MKKISMLVVVAVVMVFAGSAMAFDVGGSLKSAGKKAASGAVKGAASGTINKELAKEKYQCTWNSKTKAVEACDLKKVAAYLSGQRTAVESTGSSAGNYTDFDINIHAKDYDAYQKVRGQLQTYGVGSWDINRNSAGVSDSRISFTVAIN